MKKLILVFLLLILSSCGIRQNVNECYYVNTVKYKVYKEDSGERYIIVDNERFYVEKRKCKSFNEPFNYVIW